MRIYKMKKQKVVFGVPTKNLLPPILLRLGATRVAQL